MPPTPNMPAELLEQHSESATIYLDKAPSSGYPSWMDVPLQDASRHCFGSSYPVCPITFRSLPFYQSMPYTMQLIFLGEAVQYLPSTPARCFDNKRRTRCNGHHLQFSFSLYYDSSIYTIILETTTLNRYCLTCGRSTNPVMLEDQASLEYP